MTLSEKVKELWNRACQWDEIPPESKFVVFSVENPWVKVYNAAMIQLQRRCVRDSLGYTLSESVPNGEPLTKIEVEINGNWERKKETATYLQIGT